MKTIKGKQRKTRAQKGSALAPGERVAITASWHSDVVPGQVGTVRERVAHGYSVEITALFADALRPHERSARPATRCVFFARGELKRFGERPSSPANHAAGGADI